MDLTITVHRIIEQKIISDRFDRLVHILVISKIPMETGYDIFKTHKHGCIGFKRLSHHFHCYHFLNLITSLCCIESTVTCRSSQFSCEHFVIISK